MIKLKPFRQTPGLCGPASLKMVMDYYGVSVSEKEIARVAGSTRERGTSIRGLIRTARRFGFKAIFRKDASLKDLEYFIDKKIPIIVDWFDRDGGHYSVVVDINKRKVVLMDPALRKILLYVRRRVLTRELFYSLWFDFPYKFIRTPKDLVLRAMLVIWKTETKKK